MTLDPIYAPPGHVNFNGEMILKLYQEPGSSGNNQPLDPLVRISQNKSYPGKSLIGDPTVASHDYLSTWGMSDMSGGHGIHEHRAGITDQRYRRATLAVDRAGAWTTQIATLPVAGMAGELARPMGELWDGSEMKMYATYDERITIFVPADLDAGVGDFIPTGDSFSDPPVKEATVFLDRLVSPLGSAGYGTYDGTTATSVAADSTHPAAMDFCVFGGTQLLCVDTVNQLWVTTDLTTWEAIGVADGRPMKVQAGVRARAIEEYRDSAGEPIAEVVTSGGVYNFDPAGPTLYPKGWKYPQHPHSGLAAVVHDDVFYVNAGLDVRSLVSGSDSPMGLNRDDGLGPGMSKAYITSLASEYNALWALVQGVVVPNGDSRNELHRWDGMGWFEWWSADYIGGATPDEVTSIVISGAEGAYWIFWGEGNSIHYSRIPIGDTNPRTILYDEGSFRFQANGFWESGMTNHGMPGSKFTGVSFALRGSWVSALASTTPGDYIDPEMPQVYYRTKRDASWTELTPTFVEADVLPAAGETTEDQTFIWWMDADFRGVVYEEIEFRVESANGFVIKWCAHYFMKQMAGSYGVDLSFDMRKPVAQQNGAQAAPHVQDAYLKQMMLEGKINRMTYGRNTINVAFIQWTGNDLTGQHETRGIRNASVFEVVDRP